jgi:hypothetical protein
VDNRDTCDDWKVPDRRILCCHLRLRRRTGNNSTNPFLQNSNLQANLSQLIFINGHLSTQIYRIDA